MQTHDDLLIFEKYKQQQQLNEIMGYGFSPVKRVLSKVGFQGAKGKVELEKQANDLVKTLKYDATRSGYSDYKQAATDEQWMSGWLNSYVGANIASAPRVKQAIQRRANPFDIIRMAITQSDISRFKGAAQQPAQQPTAAQPTQQPVATAAQPTTANQPAAQPTALKSTAAQSILKQIQKLQPAEQSFIKQNLP